MLVIVHIRFEPAKKLFWPWAWYIKPFSQKEFNDLDGRSCCKYIPKEVCVCSVCWFRCICFPTINLGYLLKKRWNNRKTLFPLNFIILIETKQCKLLFSLFVCPYLEFQTPPHPEDPPSHQCDIKCLGQKQTRTQHSILTD